MRGGVVACEAWFAHSLSCEREEEGGGGDRGGLHTDGADEEYIGEEADEALHRHCEAELLSVEPERFLQDRGGGGGERAQQSLAAAVATAAGRFAKRAMSDTQLAAQINAATAVNSHL